MIKRNRTMTGERHTTVLNLSCLYAVIWGAFILWPYTETFATQPQLWKPMSQMAPEAYWGLFFILSGVGAYILDRWKAFAGSLVMFLMFISIAVLFFLGDFERPGWALIGMLAVFNAIQWRAGTWKPTFNG
jgi:hypothetical protein